MVFFCLCSTSCTYHNTLRPIHVVRIHAFLSLGEYSIVCMCHIFFIPLSVDGHLGGFHILAVVNKAAINTGVQIPFKVTVLDFFG